MPTANAAAPQGAQGLDGKALRAHITAEARQTAVEALQLVDAALEADGAVDEAALATARAERTGDRAKLREARQAERAARRQSTQAHVQASRRAAPTTPSGSALPTGSASCAW